MQQFAWIMWSMTQDEVTQDCFETAKNRVFAQNQPLFQEQLDKLSSYQLHFLRAIADGAGDRINHKEVIEEYDLGSSANVAGIKKALKNKELIDTIGIKLQIADPILQHWLRANLFN